MSHFLAVLRSLLTMSRGVLGGLSEEQADPDPIAQFRAWFQDAQKANLYLPEAMAVATATPDGRPSTRMMLLKGFDPEGFLFYTNYGSRKARELDANPRASLLFYWGVLQRQVRIEGEVERLTEAESAAYFATRPRGSQLGAWASSQSSAIADRAELESNFQEHDKRFAGRDVELPPFWGGYRLVPSRIEFWQGRANRLHDRLAYDRTSTGWEISRLAP